MTRVISTLLRIAALGILLTASPASSQFTLDQEVVDDMNASDPSWAREMLESKNLLDKILKPFEKLTKTWSRIISGAANSLFISLATLSLIYLASQQMLGPADEREWFGVVFRYLITTGFFWWCLQNGPDFGERIILSCRQLGADAAGLSSTKALSPSGIMDIGFKLIDSTARNVHVLEIVDNLVAKLLSHAVFIILALLAIDLVVLLCVSWALVGAGQLYLGFGGASWTSDIATNYFRMVLAIGVQMFGMTVVIGMAQSMVEQYTALIGTEQLHSHAYAVYLGWALALYKLANKLPAMLAGGIMGANPMHSLGGGSTAGGVASAMGTAAMGAKMAAGIASAIPGAMAASLAGSALLKGAETALNAAEAAVMPQGAADAQGADKSSGDGSDVPGGSALGTLEGFGDVDVTDTGNGASTDEAPPPPSDDDAWGLSGSDAEQGDASEQSDNGGNKDETPPPPSDDDAWGLSGSDAGQGDASGQSTDGGNEDETPPPPSDDDAWGLSGSGATQGDASGSNANSATSSAASSAASSDATSTGTPAANAGGATDATPSDATSTNTPAANAAGSNASPATSSNAASTNTSAANAAGSNASPATSSNAASTNTPAANAGGSNASAAASRTATSANTPAANPASPTAATPNSGGSTSPASSSSSSTTSVTSGGDSMQPAQPPQPAQASSARPSAQPPPFPQAATPGSFSAETPQGPDQLDIEDK